MDRHLFATRYRLNLTLGSQGKTPHFQIPEMGSMRLFYPFSYIPFLERTPLSLLKKRITDRDPHFGPQQQIRKRQSKQPVFGRSLLLENLRTID
jgi:hypothetical protein